MFAATRHAGLTSCWGDKPERDNFTTHNARTYLQPQLNKASKRDEIMTKGDVNPKDFILFAKDKDSASALVRVVETNKDNTGRREYVEDMVFPTLEFPSDHGVLETVLALGDTHPHSHSYPHAARRVAPEEAPHDATRRNEL
jgi:hypothetical protein